MGILKGHELQLMDNRVAGPATVLHAPGISIPVSEERNTFARPNRQLGVSELEQTKHNVPHLPAANMLLSLKLFTVTAVTVPGTAPRAVHVEFLRLYIATLAEVPSDKVNAPPITIKSWLD